MMYMRERTNNEYEDILMMLVGQEMKDTDKAVNLFKTIMNQEYDKGFEDGYMRSKNNTRLEME